MCRPSSPGLRQLPIDPRFPIVPCPPIQSLLPLDRTIQDPSVVYQMEWVASAVWHDNLIVSFHMASPRAKRILPSALCSEIRLISERTGACHDAPQTGMIPPLVLPPYRLEVLWPRPAPYPRNLDSLSTAVSSV